MSEDRLDYQPPPDYDAAPDRADAKPRPRGGREKKQKRHPICPEGEHEFEVISAKRGKSKRHGDLYIWALLRPTRHVKTEWVREILMHTCSKEVSIQIVREKFMSFQRACGVDPPRESVADLSAADIVGRRIVATVEHKPCRWKGRLEASIVASSYRRPD